ncbi:potassium-transporting ATPase B chain [Ferrimicrobium acidiphilum DSM 19497]|uniref:Potassium-transporting ATPase ATP-binding subunit n=2 Tax=Ferrimicrobium acidiphilum TaxID=121039 RepID=A0A0D8FTC7_9ACTN|nr:potassium-transporting ATPase subunit KdpB [Ferrimicrobium acidiphilum]KJE76533.1 potassium-transporting ATPase B chain [Ferrimicrobium acidiphilum DSM 19497]
MSELDPKGGAGPDNTVLDTHGNDDIGSASGAGAVSPRGRRRAMSMWDRELVSRSLRVSLRKLDPRALAHNPVMFVVEIGSVFTTIDAIRYLISGRFGMFSFIGQITIWLWLTVLFANFAEAMAEGRGQAHADELRRTRSETEARRVTATGIEVVPATSLVPGDIVVVSAGEVIPGDGEIIEGIASVDESAITGESAPVIRESGGDRSAVTGGTTVLSDEIRVRITAGRGESFLDRMIALIEAGVRQKTPNEIALALLLAGLTLIFLVVVVTLAPFSVYSRAVVSVTVLIALLVALIPTTIGGLLSAIGISGMNRLLEHNVLALSGRAVEAAGDVNVIMLDKTGTLTMGSRQATSFVPSPGVDERRLAEAAQLSSLADETPEGRSIVALANEKFGIQTPNLDSNDVVFVPFTAQTRMSGVDLDGRRIRKGATESVARWAEVELDPQTIAAIERIAREGSTPLLVAEDHQILGAVELKDVVKEGIKERLASLRAAGIKTVMITGDNPVTAEAIAHEVGVDDFLAEATPERKMDYVKSVRTEGYMVGMVGDGTNDAPALAVADVAVAMNTGTMAAREAGNMIDLDSNPTKLIDIVEVGKQILITRGALTTFSVVNDVAKYFAIIPAMFVVAFPGLNALNVMRLTSPDTAILSAIIFNALIIPALIPLALRGVRYTATSAASILRKNLLIYGLGGLIVPFAGIKVIDMIVTALHLVSTAR